MYRRFTRLLHDSEYYDCSPLYFVHVVPTLLKMYRYQPRDELLALYRRLWRQQRSLFSEYACQRKPVEFGSPGDYIRMVAFAGNSELGNQILPAVSRTKWYHITPLRFCTLTPTSSFHKRSWSCYRPVQGQVTVFQYQVTDITHQTLFLTVFHLLTRKTKCYRYNAPVRPTKYVISPLLLLIQPYPVINPAYCSL